MTRCFRCRRAYALAPSAPCHYCTHALTGADTIVYDSEGKLITPAVNPHEEF